MALARGQKYIRKIKNSPTSTLECGNFDYTGRLHKLPTPCRPLASCVRNEASGYPNPSVGGQSRQSTTVVKWRHDEGSRTTREPGCGESRRNDRRRDRTGIAGVARCRSGRLGKRRRLPGAEDRRAEDL